RSHGFVRNAPWKIASDEHSQLHAMHHRWHERRSFQDGINQLDEPLILDRVLRVLLQHLQRPLSCVLALIGKRANVNRG
ncbi:MAG TPA: hypothetical protein VGX46_04120, partial [Vicinamibacterales bacterium]|nr:hypothetical protein [Vicinamibacterales bacterium]